MKKGNGDKRKKNQGCKTSLAELGRDDKNGEGDIEKKGVVFSLPIFTKRIELYRKGWH